MCDFIRCSQIACLIFRPALMFFGQKKGSDCLSGINKQDATPQESASLTDALILPQLYGS